MARKSFRYTWIENSEKRDVIIEITTLYRVMYEREAARRNWPLANKSPEGALAWIAWKIASDSDLTALTYPQFLGAIEDDPYPVDEFGDRIDDIDEEGEADDLDPMMTTLGSDG